MVHRSAAAFAAVVVVGLGLWLLTITSLAPRGTGAEPVLAAVDEATGDAVNCDTGLPVVDPKVDITGVSFDDDLFDDELLLADSRIKFTVTLQDFAATYAKAHSIAVVIRLGDQQGIAQKHAGTETRGLLNDQGNVIQGTEDDVTILEHGVSFIFPEIADGADLKIDAFHQQTLAAKRNCDSASSTDPTAPTATATPTEEAPEPTETPTPTVLSKGFVIVLKHVLLGPGVHGTSIFSQGWEMKIFDGDNCTGSPVASGLTVEVEEGNSDDSGAGQFRALLQPGDYSASETAQAGWERVLPEAFCQTFTIVGGEELTFIEFTNRMVHNGDINKDGITNAVDASIILQHVAGLISRLDLELQFNFNVDRSDVNLDGALDSLDVLLILQLDAGLIDSLPVGG